MVRDHLGPWNLHLNKLGTGLLDNAASEPSGAKEEDFLIFFYVFLSFEPRTPWRGTILDPWTFI